LSFSLSDAFFLGLMFRGLLSKTQISWIVQNHASNNSMDLTIAGNLQIQDSTKIHIFHEPQKLVSMNLNGYNGYGV
jgi:hypothetical protein